MGNGRQSHTKTCAAEQRVPTNFRQHSRKVDTVTCNKINNITITIEATINECMAHRQASSSISGSNPHSNGSNAQ